MTTSTLHRSACPLDCPDTCSLEVEVENGRVTRLDGTHDNPFTAGFICSKVRRFDRLLYGDERLLTPGIRDGVKGEGSFRNATWDEALELVASKLAAARDASGGESILPLCYGGSNGLLTQDTTDARFFRRLGASTLLRTVCAVPSGAAAQGLYGKMVGTDFFDYLGSKLIVVWGTNPSATGIHLVPLLKAARKRGAKLVVVDPRRIPLASNADLHLAPRPGTDLVVALSIHRWLFESGRADLAFLDEHTTGSELLRERAAEWTFERAGRESGIEPSVLEAFAQLYADSAPAVIRCGWGPERNRNGGSAIAAILALPAVAGKFGVRGGGYTMSNGRRWEFKSDAAAHEPVPAVRQVNMNHVGRYLVEPEGTPIECLFVYNANPLATLPHQTLVRRGLEREDLFTVVFDQVMTDTARYADVILPATTFLEHTEMRASYGFPALQRADAAIPAVGESRANYDVFAELCQRLGLERPGDPAGVEELTRTVLAASAVNSEQAAEVMERGIVLPAQGPAPVQFVDHLPPTEDHKVHLASAALEQESERGLYVYLADPGDERHPLALISPALASTVSSTFGQTLGATPLSMHPDDASERGLQEGAPVRVYNEYGEVHCAVHLDADLRVGTTLLPKGLWCQSTANGNTSNALSPDTLSDIGQGACFNDARVQVERMDAAANAG